MAERANRRSPEDGSLASHAPPPERGQSSDDAALAALYREHGEQLAAYLRKAFGDGPPDPDDVAQEAFHRLVRQESLDRINNLRAFLWRTARNILLSQKRNIETRSQMICIECFVC